MKEYAIILRGYAQQTVYVDAASPAEAKAKAESGEFHDTDGYPDWERLLDGSWNRWPAHEPAEVVRVVDNEALADRERA